MHVCNLNNTISTIPGVGKVHTIVQVIGHEWFGYGKMKTLKLIANDGTGSVELVAFNRPFMEKTHPVGQIAALTAKCEFKYGKIQATSFELEKIAADGNLADAELSSA